MNTHTMLQRQSASSSHGPLQCKCVEEASTRRTSTVSVHGFGYDFSGVRVHTDARAAESVRAVNALAYTVGQDVVFGAGWPLQFAGRGLGGACGRCTHPA